MGYFEEPILVLGLPRSGTSMIAGSLKICGAWTGRTVEGGGKENPRGFFEHIVIRENIVKPLLKHLGCDPLGVKSLPSLDINMKVRDLVSAIRHAIESDGYNNDMPWLYKDAKLTLLWPMFAYAFPRARWVIVRRDSRSIINSCLRTSFMRQHSTDYSYWEDFVNEYLRRIDALKDSGAAFHEVWSQDVIDGNLEPLEALAGKLDLIYRERELLEFISPDYWHGDDSSTGDTV